VGGPYFYADYLEAISNPKHPDHQKAKKWSADVFDTTFDSSLFDIRQVNSYLAEIKPRKTRKKGI